MSRSDGLGLYFKDLYPNFAGTDTGINANPDVNEQDALLEDVAVAEKASVNESSKRNILLALLIIVLIVVFFGAGGE